MLMARVTLAAAIVAFVAAAVGCSEAPAKKKDVLALGDDEAESASKKKSADVEGEGPKNDNGTIELGSGTRGTEAGGTEGDTSDAKPAPTECKTDPECNQTGRICTGGACVKGCRNAAGCAANQICDAHGQCAFDDSNVECYVDWDCALGTICNVAYQCEPGCYGANDCPQGQACTAGQCKVATSTGTTTTTTPQCTSDGACNPGINGSGKICSPQGTCVDGCHKDYQCPGVKICSDGQCR
jgi:hypothetical protein